MRFELLINDEPFGQGLSPNSFLDTFQEESVSFNYNIADITDISKKNSSYSKTIQLPDTKNNRIVFTNLFNIENTSENTNDFNTNRKVKCWVLADMITIFKGNLQLTNIVYDFENNRHLYEVVIYSDNDTLFKTIGEQYLTDLDLSRYDHAYTRQNIEKSWGLNGGSGEFTDGYFYPLIDYGFPLFYPELSQTNYSIYFNKLYPGIYAKIIFDQIFSQAGYSYTSNFLNNYRFTDLIVPFSNKTFKPTPTIITGADDLIFAAIKSATTSISFQPFQQSQSTLYGFSTLAVDSIIFDPNNLYDTATYSYINPPNETFKQRFSINFKIRTTSNISYTPWSQQGDNIIIYCKRSTKSDGTLNPSWSNTPTLGELKSTGNANYFRDITFNGGIGIRVDASSPAGTYVTTKLPNVSGQVSNWLIEGTVTTDWVFTEPLQPNEEVKFFIYREYSLVQFPTQLQFEICTDTKIWGTLDPTEATFGSNISIENILPTNVKQKDFLISIFKMFNLYIEPASELENHLIIEPRDEYYSRYLIAKDWSNKLDLSKDINSEILSNLQKRTNFFSYKSDKDIYNSNYTTTTNEIFGQFKFELQNDFISGDNKIEPVFSPTPIDRLPGQGDFYLPIIANLNNGNYVKPDGMNIRILFRQLKTVTTNPFVVLDPITNVQYAYTFYPYVGADDDPLNPNYTLNFGSISPFITGYTPTLKNLFNIYYRNQIAELNDKGSRLITANFNLDYNDISTFRFSDLIYTTIGGMSSWYRVVKIMDYDPIAKNSTKVQLTKAYNYKLPDPTGATPSVEFCDVKTEISFAYESTLDFLSTIGGYVNSEWPWLTFYNTYENVGYSYGQVSENIGIADLEMWAATSGIPNFTISYNTSEQVLTIAWKINVPCDTGPYQLLVVMSDAEDSLSNIQPIVSSVPIECSCENLNRISPYTQEGLRNTVTTDNIYIGVVNTSTTNRTVFPNVAMIGTNNTINSIGILSLGDSNSASGANSLLVGQSNQSLAEQSFIVGDTNIINGKNSFAIGSSNLVSPPQSFVLGIGNQLQTSKQGSFTFSSPGTTSVFGTFSEAGTQSIVVIGNNNNALNTSGYVYGNSNFIDETFSYPFVLGNNNTMGSSYSASFSVQLENVVLFGNNNSIINTVTQSVSNLFIIGNNLNLTQSIPSDTLYLQTENIILNENGGFNPPFIISDAVSTTQSQTGQSVIKTITGFYENLTAGNITIDLTKYINSDVISEQRPVAIDAFVRMEVNESPVLSSGIDKLYAVFSRNNTNDFVQIGSTDLNRKDNFTVPANMFTDLIAYGPSPFGDDGIGLYIEVTGSDLCSFYWDITFRYRYE